MSTDNTKRAVLKPENMTIYEAMDLQALFSATLADFKQIEVNLSQVVEIDSAGLQLMVALKNDALEQKKKVVFTAHSLEVIELFELFNMTQFFGDPVVL
ncbi:STAS domain-containing protein [Psychromonas antarctica]|uniref:STAS domain-containing protein n=1 Tax=Psychromonas antarctica TaxID=67573 RepID=UPI001EE8358E|nr:STAS domain-containing protein [Psychromonas antarctica]MCG6202491.1 STAS domain-containing protein [Psychromonas antarctica]